MRTRIHTGVVHTSQHNIFDSEKLKLFLGFELGSWNTLDLDFDALPIQSCPNKKPSYFYLVGFVVVVFLSAASYIIRVGDFCCSKHQHVLGCFIFSISSYVSVSVFTMPSTRVCIAMIQTARHACWKPLIGCVRARLHHSSWVSFQAVSIVTETKAP